MLNCWCISLFSGTSKTFSDTSTSFYHTSTSFSGTSTGDVDDDIDAIRVAEADEKSDVGVGVDMDLTVVGDDSIITISPGMLPNTKANKSALGLVLVPFASTLHAPEVESSSVESPKTVVDSRRKPALSIESGDDVSVLAVER